jgi:hypothetical protein
VQRSRDHALHCCPAQHSHGRNQPGIGEDGIGARHLATLVYVASKLPVVAEADGNRTRLTRMPGHSGFEDREGHQPLDASMD